MERKIQAIKVMYSVVVRDQSADYRLRIIIVSGCLCLFTQINLYSVTALRNRLQKYSDVRQSGAVEIYSCRSYGKLLSRLAITLFS